MNTLRVLFDDLVRVEILLWEAVDRRLRGELDLPLGHMLAIEVIDSTPGCRVQEVAEGLAITVGAASKLVDRLAAGGLCTRSPNPADRRSSLLATTSTGRAARERGAALLEVELSERLPTLSATDLSQLMQLLSATRASLTARPSR